MPARAVFHFDPNCPWTWLTSRWLVHVAAMRHFDVHWRPLSLAYLNDHVDPASPVPDRWRGREDEFRARSLSGVALLRIVVFLGARGEHRAAGALYTEWGQRVHVERRPATLATVADAAVAASLEGPARSAASDERLDASVRSSTDDALALAGPDVGSPVLVVPGALRAVFGPIVSPVPTGSDALRLLDAVTAFASIPQIYELKHGRPSGGPHLQALPGGLTTAGRSARGGHVLLDHRERLASSCVGLNSITGRAAGQTSRGS